MRIIKQKILSYITAFAAALTAVCCAPAELSPIVYASAEELSSSGWEGSYSIDKTVHPEGCTYSIKVTNEAYTVTEVKRSFPVKKNSHYIFSAKVKYSGYSLYKDSETSVSGACIGKTFSWNYSSFSTASEWTQLSFRFSTENETSYELSLYNGIWNGYCIGTAWFSDIKIEPYTTENSTWYTDSSGEYTVSVDTLNTYKNSPYSIKIENNEYTVGLVKKEFAVEPDTCYRFSAMVKYSGLKIAPDAETKDTGAYLARYWTYENSGATKSESWSKVEFSFFTGDATEYVLALQNGIWNSRCKGTAWFSNIRLEKADTTNKWNVLALVFRNANGTAKLSNGQKVRIKSSFTDNEISFYRNTLDLFYDDFEKVSDGLMDIRNIDFRTTDFTLSKFKPYDYEDQWGISIHCSEYDWSDPAVKKEIRKFIGNNTYQQIILIVPSDDSFGWWGLTGTGFDGINCSVIKGGHYDYMTDSGYPTNVFIHEMAHGLEHNSNCLREIPIAALHSMEDYGYTGSEEKDNYKWYHDYYRNKIKGGEGIDPRVFMKPDGKYCLVSDDMTPDASICGKNTLPVHISKVIRASAPEDKYFAGKALKPSVKVTGAVKGIDYSISYKDNKAPGQGKVIIKGRGKYTGSVELTFGINLKKPTVKLNGSKLKWSEVVGASGYEIYYRKNGGSFRLLKSTSGTDYSIFGLEKGTYELKIRSYAQTDTNCIYSNWSKIVKYTK